MCLFHPLYSTRWMSPQLPSGLNILDVFQKVNYLQFAQGYKLKYWRNVLNGRIQKLNYMPTVIEFLFQAHQMSFIKSNICFLWFVLHLSIDYIAGQIFNFLSQYHLLILSHKINMKVKMKSKVEMPVTWLHWCPIITVVLNAA